MRIEAMQGNGTVYLDHMASTPLDPEVLDAMLPWLAPERAANPHSDTHRPGWRAAEAVAEARASVAALIGARPEEIVLTSGATEANNLALLGAVPEGWPVLASAIEHPSVLACVAELARRGHRTALLPVDARGRLDLDALDRALHGGPALVALMAASNEVGTIQPLAEAARLCRARGALLFTDAVQLLATGRIDAGSDGPDLLSLSGHKLYGPMGIGALFRRRGVAVRPLMFGGGQQEGLRPGTLPTAACVGLGAACRVALARRDADAARLLELREKLATALAAAVPDLRRNSPAEDCLPGCLNVGVPGLDAADMLLDLPDLALSTGSACASGGGPSHVLLAMGLSPDDAHGSLRIGLGRFTSEADIDHAAARLAEAIGKARPR
jgi:cysteine desulfurase